MACFNLYGRSYYFVNGNWVDCNNNRVSHSLAYDLNTKYPNAASLSDKKPIAQIKKAIKQRKTAPKQNFEYPKKNSSVNSSSESQSYKRKYRPRTTPRKDVSYTDLTVSQQKALKILESGVNVFLTGEAGTGKSYVLREYIRRNREKNIIVCAPTGVAAINIGGSTLHRVFGVPLGAIKPGDSNKNPSDAVKKANTIIIDEISMCRFDVFEYVVRTIINATEQMPINGQVKKQLIVVGDFYQLPPVITPSDKEYFDEYWGKDKVGLGYAFLSPLWKEMNFTNIILSEIVRQNDIEMIKNLNKVRIGDYTGIDWFNQNAVRESLPDGIYLCGSNRKADDINERKAASLSEEGKEYRAEISGEVKDTDKITTDVLLLKKNMQVMTLINNSEKGYQNGSMGTITKLGSNGVEIKLRDGKLVKVEPYEWEIADYEVQDEQVVSVVAGKYKQLPLRMAYAITIHKSQGQTYSSANIYPDCFSPGQLYVALSRVRSIRDMNLEHRITRSSLKTSEEVQHFYDNLVNSV